MATRVLYVVKEGSSDHDYPVAIYDNRDGASSLSLAINGIVEEWALNPYDASQYEAMTCFFVRVGEERLLVERRGYRHDILYALDPAFTPMKDARGDYMLYVMACNRVDAARIAAEKYKRLSKL